MMDLAEVQKKLGQVSCPLCGRSKLDARLRCDLGLGECLTTAACRSCGSSYEVSAEEPPDSICPHCGEGRAELSLRCETSSKQCFHVSCCRRCGKETKSGGTLH